VSSFVNCQQRVVANKEATEPTVSSGEVGKLTVDIMTLYVPFVVITIRLFPHALLISV